jgi:CheY-like chemotaxis protein
MGKLKVLIAEDAKVFRMVYDLGLSGDQFEKRFAVDGLEAVAAFSEFKPDIVVMDIQMPNMTGYEALKKIRLVEPYSKVAANNGGGRTTVVIMATGMGTKEDIMDCLQIGIHGYMVKPVDKATVTEKIMGYYNRIHPAIEGKSRDVDLGR